MSALISASGLPPNANFPTAGTRANTPVRPYGWHRASTQRKFPHGGGAGEHIGSPLRDGIGSATQRKFPHGGDSGEHMGSPLRDGDNPGINAIPKPT